MWVYWFENGETKRLSCIDMHEAAALVLELATHPEVLYTSIEVDGVRITEMPLGWIKDALMGEVFVIEIQATSGTWHRVDLLGYYKSTGLSGLFRSREDAWKQIDACRTQIKVPMHRVRVSQR